MIPAVLNEIYWCPDVEVVHGAGGGVPGLLVDELEQASCEVFWKDLELALQGTESGADHYKIGRSQNNVSGTLIVRQVDAAFPSHLNCAAIIYTCCVNFIHQAIVCLSPSILGAHGHVIYFTWLPFVQAEI